MSEEVDDSWAQLSPKFSINIKSSSVTTRTSTLKDFADLLQSNKVPKEDLPSVAHQLLNTFNYYQDDASRNIVISILKIFIQLDSTYLNGFVKFISTQSKTTKAVAVSNFQTLLTWINEFIQYSSLNNSVSEEMVIAQGNLLEKIISASYVNEVEHIRSNSQNLRLYNSAISKVKSCLVKIFTIDDNLPEKYIGILTQKTSSPRVSILLLGVLDNAIEKLSTTKPSISSKLDKKKILNFFGEQILLTKNPFPQSYFNVMGNFIHKLTEKEFVELILPNLEKANLRSPDYVFSLLPNFYEFLNPETCNVGSFFATSKLASQFISAFKSSKDTTRNGALNCFVNVSQHLKSDKDTVNLLLTANKSITNLDQKVVFAKALNSIPVDIECSSLILKALTPIVEKDQNEISLESYVSVYMFHAIGLLSLGQDIELKSILTGISDKKLNLRRFWAIELGNYLFQANITHSSNLISALNKIYPSLLKSTQEAIASPLPTVTNKGIVTAYVTLAIGKLANLWNNEEIMQQFQNILPSAINAESGKYAILTSPTIYAKLSTNEEQIWFVRALDAVPDQFTTIAYGNAWLYTCSNHFSVSARRLALSLIEEHETSCLVSAIYEELRNNKDIEVKFLSPVISQISKSGDEKLALDLLIACNYIPVTGGWTGFCQRINVDAGKIIAENADKIIEECLNESPDSSLYNATIKSLSLASFVQPEIVAPKLASYIESATAPENLTFDDLSIQIFNAPEGELVINPIKKSNVENKNTKDYETRKWEESVRKELASKGKLQKNYTKEEQSLINEQLKKESEIRSKIKVARQKAIRAIDIVNQLHKDGKTVDNGKLIWYVTAVRCMLLCSQKYTGILGDAPIDSYIALSWMKDDDQPRPELIGASILNAYEVKSRFSNAEPLESLLKGLNTAGHYVRHNFSIKAHPEDDKLRLIYAVPLFEKILERDIKFNKTDKKKKPVSNSEDQGEEYDDYLFEYLMETLEFCAEYFEDPVIPRTNILRQLLILMNFPARSKTVKSQFIAICQAIADNISDNDLQVLYDGLLLHNSFVRNAILEALDSEFTFEGGKAPELYICKFDNSENCSELAEEIWEEGGFTPPTVEELLEFANNTDYGVRLSIGKAIQTIANGEIQPLIDHYWLMEKPPAKQYDEFGLEIKTDQIKDRWENRSTVALALNEIVPDDVKLLVSFLIEGPAVADQEEQVRQKLQEAGLNAIRKHGAEMMEELIPIFERCLASSTNSREEDRIKESTIVLYGSLVSHLKSSDPRLSKVVELMINTLDTPSEDVQYSISTCIAPLAPKVELSHYIEILFEKLFDGKSYASRRGAAYGLAGLVKGSGLKALSDFEILRELSSAADDRKNPKKREGVAFAFECLSQALGKYFEPYFLEALPLLLQQLGDPIAEVRVATDAACKEIMRHTSSYGVKLLIPMVISNLDEIAWRSKKSSVELLGSMAYLDPAQLSASLSTIVPEIVGVLNDTHKEVRKAADASLKKFGLVIRNPEIQEIVPVLLNAIGDPTKYTDAALDKLIKTQFIHYIDGPSLALIIHVIHRGMNDRSAGTKRKACQIVGNMAFLVEAKDLAPYLSQLVSELEVAMVDPVSATRATAARAIGSLVEKLGEHQFPDLIPRLFNNLQDEEKAGDRLGSAQALAEIISGLGLSKLEEFLPEIIKQAQSSRSHIRAGFMPMLLFLPVCFGNQFAPYISKVISPILTGLADSDEEIRDTSMRVGKLIVKNYAHKAVDLLLPELESGFSDDDYIIRHCSVQLTGDLLFQLNGSSGKIENIDEIEQGTKDRVLSLLFICRSDVTSIVRTTALDVWNALVDNTPRTIKEILPTLTHIVVKRLASPNETQRIIGAQTLGDMVSRVGRDALTQILPTFEDSFSTSDNDSKQGICIALTTLIENINMDSIIQYQKTFVKIVKIALSDSADEVREAAAQAFEVLQENLGNSVADEIIPHLLKELQSNGADKDNSLSALKSIMATKANAFFPMVLPKLLDAPIDSFKAASLASLATVAGSALYKKLTVIINSLIDAIILNKNNPEEKAKIESSFDIVATSVEDEGLHNLMQTILSLVKNEDAEKRSTIYRRLGPFFTNTTLDYSIYTQDMVSQFVMSLGDRSDEVVHGTFEALLALVKSQPKENLEKLIKPAKQALSLTGVRGENLAGFDIARGPSCILPIFLQGLMYGNSEDKLYSAEGIADLISKTKAENLKTFATTITGPLIRVIGEKVSSDTKAAILDALTLLLGKIPAFLRPFIPQLQRTFVRSLSDPQNEDLRNAAVTALGTLIAYQPRVDPLITELVTGAKAATEQGIKTAVLRGILEVITKAGQKMSESSKNAVLELVEEEITKVSDKSAVSYARLVGTLAQSLSSEEATNILKNKILVSDDAKFAVLSINAFLKESPQHIFNTGLLPEVVNFVEKMANDALPYVSDNGTVAAGKILLLNNLSASPKALVPQPSQVPFVVPEQISRSLVETLSKNMLAPASNSLETRRLSITALRTVARQQYELIKPTWDLTAPSVFTCVRDPIIPIRLAAEKCFIQLFNMVEDQELKDFHSWFDGKTSFTNSLGTSIVARSIGDYTKRVGSRLAGVERERINAGGDDETLYSDRIEDENEVWAVGGVDKKVT